MWPFKKRKVIKNSITNEELKKVVEEVIDNDKELSNIVFDITLRIKELATGTKTSIAKLIGYNPREAFVEPLTQGKVSCYVKEVCKRIEIKLEEKRDSFGGLAYFYEFTKC